MFFCVSVALSVAMWYAVHSSFGSLEAPRALIVFAAGSLFLSLFVLGTFIFSLYEMAVLSAAFPIGFFVVMGDGWVIGILAFLLFFYAAMVMRYQIQSRTVVSFYPLASYGVPATVTALAVLFAFAAYSYPFRIQGTVEIPKEAVSYVMPFAESVIASQVPGYVKGMTVDDYLSANVTDLIQKRYGTVSLTNKQVKAALADAVEKQRTELSRQIGIPLKGTEHAEDILPAIANTYVNTHAVSYKEFIPLAVAVSVFVAMKSVGFFIGRIIVLFAWLLSRSMLAVGVLQKKKEQIEREMLSA